MYGVLNIVQNARCLLRTSCRDWTMCYARYNVQSEINFVTQLVIRQISIVRMAHAERNPRLFCWVLDRCASFRALNLRKCVLSGVCVPAKATWCVFVSNFLFLIVLMVRFMRHYAILGLLCGIAWSHNIRGPAYCIFTDKHTNYKNKLSLYYIWFHSTFFINPNWTLLLLTETQRCPKTSRIVTLLKSPDWQQNWLKTKTNNWNTMSYKTKWFYKAYTNRANSSKNISFPSSYFPKFGEWTSWVYQIVGEMTSNGPMASKSLLTYVSDEVLNTPSMKTKMLYYNSPVYNGWWGD